MTCGVYTNIKKYITNLDYVEHHSCCHCPKPGQQEREDHLQANGEGGLLEGCWWLWALVGAGVITVVALARVLQEGILLPLTFGVGPAVHRHHNLRSLLILPGLSGPLRERCHLCELKLTLSAWAHLFRALGEDHRVCGAVGVEQCRGQGVSLLLHINGPGGHVDVGEFVLFFRPKYHAEAFGRQWA